MTIPRYRLIMTVVLLMLALSSSSWADRTTPGSLPARPVQTVVDELASIERRGVDLENLNLAEIQRDSREALHVNRLRRELARYGKAAHEPLVLATIACRRASTLEMLLDVMARLKVRLALKPLEKLLMMRKRDITLRRPIPRFLSLLGGKNQVASLLETSRDRDLNLAKQAVFALAVLPGRAGIPALYQALKSGSAAARSAAAEAMGEVDEFPAVPLLIAAQLDRDHYVQTFAQGSLTTLTYRYSPDRPGYSKAQHKEWANWWRIHGSSSRNELKQMALRMNLKEIEGSDPVKAQQAANWLAELSFQGRSPAVAFRAGGNAIVKAIEVARWKTWVDNHGNESRLDWFRQAVDRAIETLGARNPAVSWNGLSRLSDLIAIPESDPYLFRAVWVRTEASDRQGVATRYKAWWQKNRQTFSPLGRKYW